GRGEGERGECERGEAGARERMAKHGDEGSVWRMAAHLRAAAHRAATRPRPGFVTRVTAVTGRAPRGLMHN
ncbi:hypothetical protein ACEN8K_31290, partial [Variovorax sp. CT11-76]